MRVFVLGREVRANVRGGMQALVLSFAALLICLPTLAQSVTGRILGIVTDQSGGVVAGATVTVTFFMPAMPAMGMGAMRVTSNLSDKGGGMYEGRGELESGGTWQVTILAQKGGQTLANKQMSVDAEGSM